LPTLRMKEIRSLPPDQRGKRLSELNIELLKLKAMVKAGGSVENPARIREIRRAIARIKTVDNEKAAKEGVSNANNPKKHLKT
jgi:large subunit ribosomal protein L29